MLYRADLHCHSIFSDGTYFPKELLDLAKEKKLSALSITDHDTLNAYTESVFDYARQLKIKLFLGGEFSTSYQDHSIDILGYGISKTEELLSFCSEQRERRNKRNRLILEKLRAKGMIIEEEELFQFGPSCTLGRPHIARLLVKKNYVKSIYEAFTSYIGEGKSCFEKRDSFGVKETIEQIHRAGGKAFLAHPHFITDNALLNSLFKEDFDGIECYYGLFHYRHEEKWIAIAKKKGCLISGGSDFHGATKPQIDLGCSWIGEEHVKKIFGKS